MGLAVTMYGGDLLATEVSIVAGKGKLVLTGKLGDVMQESAQAAISYVRARAPSLGLERDFYSRADIHVHLPEGAIPKDGPSAGITMCTGLVSALLRIPVRRDVAMTGEITLRGRVLPIGGLKEKILAAHRSGITTVIMPKENAKDLRDIPKRVLKTLRVIPVEHMDEVLRAALLLPKPEEFLTEPSVPVDWRQPAERRERERAIGATTRRACRSPARCRRRRRARRRPSRRRLRASHRHRGARLQPRHQRAAPVSDPPPRRALAAPARSAGVRLSISSGLAACCRASRAANPGAATGSLRPTRG